MKAHQHWQALLDRGTYRSLLQDRRFNEIAARALRIESRTNLIFSFEKMALRDAMKSPAGAHLFGAGLYDFVYGASAIERRVERLCEVLASLPRKQTRVLTWPNATVFGFIAKPDIHICLQPNVTRVAARIRF